MSVVVEPYKDSVEDAIRSAVTRKLRGTPFSIEDVTVKEVLIEFSAPNDIETLKKILSLLKGAGISKVYVSPVVGFYIDGSEGEKHFISLEEWFDDTLELEMEMLERSV